MPSARIHEVVARKVNKDFKMDDILLRLGAIAPDSWRNVSEDSKFHSKELTHFWDESIKEEQKNNYKKFYIKYKDKMNNPFYFGYLIHLITDQYWKLNIFPKYFIKENEVSKCKLRNGLVVEDKNHFGYYEEKKIEKRLAKVYDLGLLPQNIDDIPNFECSIEELDIAGLFGENGSVSYVNKELSPVLIDEDSVLYDYDDIEKYLNETAEFVKGELYKLFHYDLSYDDKKDLSTKDDIKEYIKSRNKELTENDIDLFANYFFFIQTNENITKKNSIKSLIDNALSIIDRVVYYDYDHEIVERLGKDCKGLRDPISKTLYIRNDLSNQMKEIALYHELHHAVQTDTEHENNVGIQQESNYGRLIMEAQTQYIAELVYEAVHNVSFDYQEIESDDTRIRMQKGGTIKSKLHNYEMYDSILTKLAIVLDVPKTFFVEINYLYKDKEGINILKERYEKQKEKYKLPLSFDELMYKIDYIYVTDLLMYADNREKERIKSGETSIDAYEIHENKGAKISKAMQYKMLDQLDYIFIISLFDNNGNYEKYFEFIFDDKRRETCIKALREFKEGDSQRDS